MKPLLSTRVYPRSGHVLLGRLALYDDHLEITGWTPFGRYHRTIPLTEIARAGWRAEEPEELSRIDRLFHRRLGRLRLTLWSGEDVRLGAKAADVVYRELLHHHPNRRLPVPSVRVQDALRS